MVALSNPSIGQLALESNMVKLGRWLGFGASVYGSLLLLKYFSEHPDAFHDFTWTGLLRIGFTCFLLLWGFLLGRSIFIEWRSNIEPKATLGSHPPQAPKDEVAREATQVTRLAFKKHPILAVFLVIVVSCTPFLIQVVSHPNRPVLDEINLRWLAVGLVILIFSLAMLRWRARP
jgi:hypothetical protein